MAVYVDRLIYYAKSPLGSRKWCHMWADTEEELHAMAQRIGMRRSWYQEHGMLGHYDLVESKRAIAVKEGDIEMSYKLWHKRQLKG